MGPHGRGEETGTAAATGTSRSLRLPACPGDQPPTTKGKRGHIGADCAPPTSARGVAGQGRKAPPGPCAAQGRRLTKRPPLDWRTEKKRARRTFRGVPPEVPPHVAAPPTPTRCFFLLRPLDGHHVFLLRFPEVLPTSPSSSGLGPRLPAPACCVTSCSALASCLRRPRRRLSGPFRSVRPREEVRETSDAAPWRTSRLSVPTRSSRPSSRTRSGCCSGTRPRRSCPGTTRTSGWASRPPRRPSRAPTLTRSVPSLATSPSEAGSCLGW